MIELIIFLAKIKTYFREIVNWLKLLCLLLIFVSVYYRSSGQIHDKPQNYHPNIDVVTILIVFLKGIHSLQISEKFRNLTQITIETLKGLIPVISLIAIIVSMFAFMDYVSAEDEEQDLNASFSRLYRVLYYDYSDYHEGTTTSSLAFIAFSLIANFVLLNLLIAIVCDNYERV